MSRIVTYFSSLGTALSVIPGPAHELAHVTCIAQAFITCADELRAIAQAGENMGS